MRDIIDRIVKQMGGTVSIAVRDISNSFDFYYNPDAQMSSASTIKVPILVEALRQARDGHISLSTNYSLDRATRCDGSGVICHLSENIAFSLQDLLTLMIIVSDNTATNFIIDLLGCDAVNATMRKMGYSGIKLNRKMYDWEAIRLGRDNLVVASEMADLLYKIALREAVGGEFDDIALNIMRGQLYGNLLGLFLPEGVLANKTGNMGTALNDCGVVKTDFFSYSIAVFTQDTNCLAQTKIDIASISKTIFDAAGKNCG